MSENSKSLASLFRAVLELKSESERIEFLETCCGEDVSLREQLNVLVDAHQRAGSFLDKPPVELAATQIGTPEQFSASNSEPTRHSVLQLMGQTIDVPRIVLDSSAEEGSGPIVRPKSTQMPRGENDGRYRLDGEIARGGMGAILKGRDTDLGRDLALKVLLDEHRNKPEVIQRFIEEAQIGGQLQHPGIVPVYELGQFKDQRPFFTMKLVKGKTLAALLSQRKSSADDRAKLLGIFEQVCQTMAYAHSRSVIHRDLKPTNVMVGAFGEVQVMDWGLAKVLTKGGIVDEKKAIDNRSKMSIIQTIRSLGSETPTSFGSGTAGTHTQMGSVLGTPAYMPPEQALGEIDRLDERSDVFGLGAILCEILTGEPPYNGEDHVEVFRKASRAKLNECYQRLQDSGCDEELVQLVRDCLEPEPDDRPRDAGELSRRVSEYLESVEHRLRDAELAKVEANTRATEERKRRRVMMALAASVLFTMSAAGGGWIWVKQKDAALKEAAAQAQIEAQVRTNQLQQQIAAELSTARALAQIDVAGLPDRAALESALAATARAANLLGTGEVDASLSREVEDLQADLEKLRRDQELLAALEDCWRLEIEYRTALRDAAQEEIDDGAGEPGTETDSDVDAGARTEAELVTLSESLKEETQLEKPSEAYARAFANWGLDPATTTHTEASQRLARLHESIRPAALVSLDRWREQLTTDKTLAAWESQEWSVLEPVELKSRGGDKLELLDDQSILASGDNAHMGYDLVFDTAATVLTALRLEALTHDSLPNKGPGRSARATAYPPAIGIFALKGLEVWYAPRTNPADRQRLWFHSAVADYSNSGATDTPLTTESWHIDGGAGESHLAVFQTRDSPISEDGFRITISHEDRENGLWGDQNIGRFRWSVTSDSRSMAEAQWLAAVALENDDDPWRLQLQEEIQRSDLFALIRRAADTDILSAQPRIIQTQLAQNLVANSHASMFSFLNIAPWEVFQAERTEVAISETATGTHDATERVNLSRKTDGSYIVSGASESHEQIVLSGPLVAENLPTAIKLELIPHVDGDQASFGRGPGGWVDFVDFEASVSVPEQPDRFAPLPVKQVMSDLPTHRPLRLNAIVDGNRRTMSPFYEGEVPHSVVFVLDKPTGTAPDTKEAGRDFRIQLRTSEYRHLARFRISVMSEAIDLPDPKLEALNLLRYVQNEDPADYWTNVSLSELCMQQTPPLSEEAMRHATAAIALRPDDVAGHAALLRSLPVDELSAESELSRVAISHVKRLNELGGAHPAVLELGNKLEAEAMRLSELNEKHRSTSLCQLALEIVPDDATTIFDIANQLGRLAEHDLAIDAFLRAIKIDGNVGSFYNNLGVAYFQKGDADQAIKMYRRAIEVQPTNTVAYRNLSRSLMLRGEFIEAVDLIRQAISGSSAKDPLAHAWLGDALLQNGDLEGAAEAYRQAIDLDNENPALHFALAIVLNKRGNKQEAIDLQKRAIELNPTDANSLNNLAWMLVSDEDASLWDAEFALELARRAVQADAQPYFFNTLGVAYYRAGNWLQAIKALNRSVEAYAELESTDGFFLAMAHWQLGDQEHARELYDKSITWMDKNAPGNEELIRFRAEAEALLQETPPDQPAPTAPADKDSAEPREASPSKQE